MFIYQRVLLKIWFSPNGIGLQDTCSRISHVFSTWDVNHRCGNDAWNYYGIWHDMMMINEIYIYIYIYIHMYSYIYIHMYSYIYIHMYSRIQAYHNGQVCLKMEKKLSISRPVKRWENWGVPVNFQTQLIRKKTYHNTQRTVSNLLWMTDGFCYWYH